MSFIKRIWILITSTFRIWGQANSSRMAAAMTYYTMLSLAPLLMIAVAIAGYVYDDKLASEELIEQVRVATSPTIADTISSLIENAIRPKSGLLASSISLLILFYGASGVFSQLYETFNVIWQVPIEQRTGIKFTIQKRLIGIGMVLIAGFSLIGSVALGSVIAYLEHLVHDSYPMLTNWLNLADRSWSLLLMPFVLALMFWFFPAAKVKLIDMLPAGILTALLIAASRYLIEFYLRFSSTSEVYGAAGSLVVLLIWIYITGLVVFFGASFSHAWTSTFGSRSNASPDSGESFTSETGSAGDADNGVNPGRTEEKMNKAQLSAGESLNPIVLQRRTPDS